MTDLNEEFKEYRAEIQRILDKTERPGDQVPDADAREILEIVKKIGALGTHLRASAKAALPADPEQPDPLAAGAQLDAMAWEASQASKGKLSYTAALHRIVADPDNLDLVLEYQASGKTRRR